MSLCSCCHIATGHCDCLGPERCFDCGACIEHCRCEKFITCECRRIDVDLEDASDCPAHGPHSQLARDQRAREAADEAEYWRSWKILTQLFGKETV